METIKVLLVEHVWNMVGILLDSSFMQSSIIGSDPGRTAGDRTGVY